MARAVHTRFTASVTDLKRNPMRVVSAGKGTAVAILNRNEIAFYCVPAKEYSAMVSLIEDAELNGVAIARAADPEIEVSLEDL